MIQAKKIYILVSVATIFVGTIGFWTITQRPAPDLTAHYIPFDESMALSSYPEIMQKSDFVAVYQMFKQMYENHSFKKLTPEPHNRIPNIIHIMWLGGKLPAEFERYVQSWYTYHPSWTILFWTDNPLNYDRGIERYMSFDDLEKRLKTVRGGERMVIDARKVSYENKRFYDAARNYGEKSDILKWEIVYRFGGTYVDTDFECLHSLDVFHHTYDFYTGIQPLDTHMVQLGAALYGAVPHHPILKACVENIKNNQHIQQIVVKTGPIHFTKMFLEVAGKTGMRDVALPVSYFYPCSYEQRGHAKQEWVKNESAAVHHWAGSWLKPEAFVRA
jgi:Mannosyltransferase OCH1 and related enzymes